MDMLTEKICSEPHLNTIPCQFQSFLESHLERLLISYEHQGSYEIIINMLQRKSKVKLIDDAIVLKIPVNNLLN